jgi:hypothetical protein
VRGQRKRRQLPLKDRGGGQHDIALTFANRPCLYPSSPLANHVSRADDGSSNSQYCRPKHGHERDMVLDLLDATGANERSLTKPPEAPHHRRRGPHIERAS